MKIGPAPLLIFVVDARLFSDIAYACPLKATFGKRARRCLRRRENPSSAWQGPRAPVARRRASPWLFPRNWMHGCGAFSPPSSFQAAFNFRIQPVEHRR
jgi:hypothetical protein